MEFPRELYLELLEHLDWYDVIQICLATGEPLPTKWLYRLDREFLDRPKQCKGCTKSIPIRDRLISCGICGKSCGRCCLSDSCEGCQKPLCWIRGSYCTWQCRSCPSKKKYCRSCLTSINCPQCSLHNSLLCSGHLPLFKKEHDHPQEPAPHRPSDGEVLVMFLGKLMLAMSKKSD